MSIRLQRVAELIKRELGSVLEREHQFKDCIVTIHDVVPTIDLKECFVYVGVIATTPGRQEAVAEKLNKVRGAIQRSLYKRVVLKSSPRLTFRLDHSVERGVGIINALDNLPPPAPPLPEGETDPVLEDDGTDS